jgi:hypothetical protein
MSSQPIVIQQKSNGVFGTTMKIIGFICLISCLCSMWSSYRTAKAVGNAIENADIRKVNKNSGPIISDMEIITRDTAPSGMTTMEITSDEPQAEAVTTKSMKVALYKTSDCTEEPVNSVTLEPGTLLSTKGEFDKIGTDKDTNYVCCVKHENVKLAGEYMKGDEKKTFSTSADGQTSIVQFGQPGGPENCATDFFINWAPRE